MIRAYRWIKSTAPPPPPPPPPTPSTSRNEHYQDHGHLRKEEEEEDVEILDRLQCGSAGPFTVYWSSRSLTVSTKASMEVDRSGDRQLLFILLLRGEKRPLMLHGRFLDLDLDQYVANHPFTGIGATVGGAQFAGTIGSWLLPEPI